MCIICCHPAGAESPSASTIERMFERNPDGAGLMFVTGDRVNISKGFMTLDDLKYAMRFYKLDCNSPFVLHFRISTQAGVIPSMTHPFPISTRKSDMKALDLLCKVGVAHNGIIRMCSDPFEHEYSDTAIFCSEYLPRLIRKPEDATDQAIQTIISRLIDGSRMAFLTADGVITRIGSWIADGGCWYSNSSYLPRKSTAPDVKTLYAALNRR